MLERGSVIEHNFIKKLPLGRCEKRVLAVIYCYTIGKYGICFAGIKKLVEQIDYSKSSIYRAISSLLSRGYVERVEAERLTGLRARLDVIYNLDTPLNKAEETEETERTAEQAIQTEHTDSGAQAEQAIQTEHTESGAQAIHTAHTACQAEAEHIALAAHTPCQAPSAKEDVEKKTAPPEKACRERRYNNIDEEFSHCLDTVGERGEKIHRYGIYSPERPPPKYIPSFYGAKSLVYLTEAQYKSLLSLVEPDVLGYYFRRFEYMLEQNDEKGIAHPHSHYRTIKSWINKDLGT